MDHGNDSISHLATNKQRPGRRGVILLRAGLIMVMLTMLFSQPALSQSSGPQAPSAMPNWTLHTVDGPRLFVNMTDRSLAFKPDGTPCAAYGGDGLYFACYNKTTGVWTVTTIDDSEGVGQYAALDFYTHPVTSVTNAYISYYDAINGALKVAFTSAIDLHPIYSYIDCKVHPGWTGFWCVLTAPTPAPSDPWRKRAGVTAGVPEVFSEEKADPNSPEPAAPENDIDFMARVQQTLAPLANLFKKDSPTINLQTQGVGKFTSIDADSWGIYISYYDDRDVNPLDCDPPGSVCYTRNLNFAYWNGVDWYFEVVDNYQDQGKTGLWSSLKVDFNHNVHIAYMSEKYDDLLYAFWNVNHPEEWTRVVVDGDTPMLNTGSMCSIALYDANLVGVKGVPYISYLDFTDNADGSPDGDLRVARLVSLNSNTWERDTVDSQGITGWWSSIAVNSNAKIFISYYLAYKSNTVGDLRLASGKIGNWNLKTLRSGDALEGQFSSIALDPTTSNELPAILNFNASTGDLQYTYFYTTTKWTTNIVDKFGHDVGYGTSLALTATGVPHISYLDQTLSLQKYASAFGDNFYNMLLDYWPSAGLFSSIDELYGIPYMASYASLYADAIYGTDFGGFWYHRYVQMTYDVGQYVSMKLDSNGIPRLSYYDATNKNLVYAAWNVSASQWITQNVDTPGDVGKYSSLALSIDIDPITLKITNRPYISYLDSEDTDSDGDIDKGILKIAYESPVIPGVWIKQVVDDGSNGTSTPDVVGLYSSIDLDGANRPSISYYNATTGDLKFATYNGGWLPPVTLDPLSPTENLGINTSLKINRTTGDRHICYYNATGGDLWYARYSSGIWEYQGIDGNTSFQASGSPDSVGGDIGYTCSIDLTAAGQPAISYYDNSRADLKLALSYALPKGLIYFPIILKK